MKRPLLIILTLSLILAGGITWFLAQLFWFSPDIVVSKRTTWLTGPLADDGLPDYAAYLLEQGREGVTPENNGAVPFLQAMWPAHLDPPEQQAIVKELGMPMPATNGLSSGGPYKSLQNWLETQGIGEEDEEVDSGALITRAGLVPWRREDFPPLAEWVDFHAENYRLLHLAATKPDFYAPSPTHLLYPEECQLLVQLDIEQTMHEAGDCLSLRCMLRLGEGDYHGAWEDAKAVYELARRVPRGSLVADFISFRLERLSNRLALTILAEPHLPREVAQTILHAYRQRAERAIVAQTVDRFERLAYVSMIFSLADVRPFDVEGELDKWKLIGLAEYQRGVDWNIVLRVGNEWYDRLVSALARPTVRERFQAVQQYEQELLTLDASPPESIVSALCSRSVRSEHATRICVQSLLPSATSTLNVEARVSAELMLHRVAAALTLYRLEHGTYPTSLDELVPAQLAEAPLDPCNSLLVYKRTSDGFLLYSTGPNGLAEQGSNENLWIYQGYDVEGDETAVRKQLGLPHYDDSADSNDPASQRLKDQIPPGADDWAIRLPLPKPDFPLSKVPPPRE